LCVVAGPPDTGKSKACEQWLSCIAKSLQLQSDGGSAKSYTADDKNRDLRCSFEDELKDLISDGDVSSGANIKAKQSLISNGIITYERLQQTNENTGEYVLNKIVKAERKMTVTCTNALKCVPDAIQSRASIVPLTGASVLNAHKSARTANTLVAIGGNRTAGILGKAFMMQLQLFSALQGRFWSLEAFGGLDYIDATCVTLFQLLLEKEHGKTIMKPRRMLDVKHASEALMVFDLVRMWYTGLGAKYGMDTTMETMFYRSRAVVRMEHVCAAFGVMTQSTSFDIHVKEIEILLKTLIKLQDGNMYEKSACGEYFILSTRNKRSLYYDVNQQMSHLGVGLTSQILNIIERGCTNGVPNVKFASENNTEFVYINCKYAASIHSPIEHAVLKVLVRLKDSLGKMCETFDEKYYVFRSAVRESICHYAVSDIKHRELESIDRGALKLAITMLSHTVSDTGDPMWCTPQQVDVCKEVDESVPNAIVYLSDSTRYKVLV